MPDSSSQAPLNDGKRWDLNGGRPVVAPTRVYEVELRGRMEGFFRNAKHSFAIHAFDKTQFTKTLFSIHDRRSIHSLRRNSLKNILSTKVAILLQNLPFIAMISLL